MIVWSCSPSDDKAINMAKSWISDNGLTRDIVRLVRNERYVAVEVIDRGRYYEVLHDSGKRNGGEGIS